MLTLSSVSLKLILSDNMSFKRHVSLHRVVRFKVLFITWPMWASVLTRANTEQNKTNYIMDMYAIQKHTEQLYCF